MLVRQCIVCGANTDNPICPDCKEDFSQTDPDLEEDILDYEDILDHMYISERF